MPKNSAGLLMFRRTHGELEVFLVHPGGPFFAKRDDGVWSVPKGEVDNGTDIFIEAVREFQEETGILPPANRAVFIELGNIKQKSGKIVHAWAFESDFSGEIKSNTTKIEWPPKSGKILEIPEVDRAEFFSLEAARSKIIAAQYELLLRLKLALKL